MNQLLTSVADVAASANLRELLTTEHGIMPERAAWIARVAVSKASCFERWHVLYMYTDIGKVAITATLRKAGLFPKVRQS